ncbi:MAG: hypothetical protein CVU41_14005 [Chloroflexi bacterium HGW-Chloroflexi-3]|nr:MAG: hypothetical protein CVU41_14005 [Chloroflexi bacterium HGW-Chloroflexi-3]
MFKRSSRVLLVTLLLFVLAGATYAYAAENTVPPTFAGDGEGTISGYTVSNIAYSTSGGNITGVSFNLNASATVVQAAMDGGTLVTCSGATTSWSCDFSGSPVSVLSASSLLVVAGQ